MAAFGFLFVVPMRGVQSGGRGRDILSLFLILTWLNKRRRRGGDGRGGGGWYLPPFLVLLLLPAPLSRWSPRACMDAATWQIVAAAAAAPAAKSQRDNPRGGGRRGGDKKRWGWRRQRVYVLLLGKGGREPGPPHMSILFPCSSCCSSFTCSSFHRCFGILGSYSCLVGGVKRFSSSS